MDKLVCPACGHFPLSLEITETVKAKEYLPEKRPCTTYCAYEDKWLDDPVMTFSCHGCLQQHVQAGKLACGNCHASYAIEHGIPRLLTAEAMSDWVTAEQNWWDRRYTSIQERLQQIRQRSNLDERRISGNRLYERNRYLFGPLRRSGISDKVVVEIGAGTSEYVATLLPPVRENLFYIGTDVSIEALYIGSQLLPEGDFVQCTVGEMPFRSGAFDVLLSLGVLHHIPSWQASLQHLIKLLKPEGWVLFNEAIEKPRVFGAFRKRSLTAAIDSPHEGEVSLTELLAVFTHNGCLVTYRLQSTPFRVLLVWMLEKLMDRSLKITELVLYLDQLFVKIFAGTIGSLGPGEVLGIFVKERTEHDLPVSSISKP